MKEKYKYLITGFVVGAITAWFFTLITLSYNNKSPEFQMGRGMMNNYMESESIDSHFIEQMIPHHEDAIDMSKLALERATRTEVKELATSIIESQTKEIENMKNWYEDWFGTGYVGLEENNFRMGPGMMRGRMGMMNTGADIQFMENAEDFDLEFVEQMIPHHQMAIMMATMLENSTTRPEMEQLAEEIIKAQTSEINLMREWLQNWEEE